MAAIAAPAAHAALRPRAKRVRLELIRIALRPCTATLCVCFGLLVPFAPFLACAVLATGYTTLMRRLGRSERSPQSSQGRRHPGRQGSER